MQNAVLFHHSDNIRNRDTLRNVTSSSLVKAKQLSFQKAALYIPRLSQYVSKIGKETFKCTTLRFTIMKKENAYQLDGMNYFLQIRKKSVGNGKLPKV